MQDKRERIISCIASTHTPACKVVFPLQQLTWEETGSCTQRQIKQALWAFACQKKLYNNVPVFCHPCPSYNNVPDNLQKATDHNSCTKTQSLTLLSSPHSIGWRPRRAPDEKHLPFTVHRLWRHAVYITPDNALSKHNLSLFYFSSSCTFEGWIKSFRCQMWHPKI